MDLVNLLIEDRKKLLELNQDNIMAVALELLVNETVNCLADMNVKMVTVQNRIELDSVLERSS